MIRRLWWLPILIAVHSGPSLGEVPAKEEENVFSAEWDGILRDWSEHDSHPESGELVWHLRGRNRSALYRIEANSAAKSEITESSETARVRFMPDGLQFDGYAVPALQLGRMDLPDSDTWSMDRGFRTALVTGKIEEDAAAHEAVPYVIHIDPRQELHLWTKQPEGTSCRVVWPVGTAGPLLLFDSTKAARLPMLWGLAEAMRLSLHPSWLLSRNKIGKTARILEARPLLLGRPCVAVEFPIKLSSTEITARLVLEPSRKHQVVRATFRKDDGVRLSQYDLAYDQDEDDVWWLKSVTVVQFNGFGDPYDELLMVRTDKKALSASEARLAPGPAGPGTWVIDQVAGRQYVVEKTEQERAVPLAEAASQLTPAKRGSHWIDKPARPLWQKVAVKFLTWPWVLLTVAVVYVGFAVIKLRKRVEQFPKNENSGLGMSATD